jgi:hypothetical protein
MRAKHKLKRQLGTSSALFQLYVHELAHHNHFYEEDIFGSFIIMLGDNYA